MQLRAILVTAWLDRIMRRAHTLSQLLEDGYSIRAADMPGADDLMMRIYAAMAQKERELISERTKTALAAARARGKALGGDRGYRPATGPDARAAALARQERAERTGHRLALEMDALGEAGITSMAGMAQALTERGVPTPRSSDAAEQYCVDTHNRRTGAEPGKHGAARPITRSLAQRQCELPTKRSLGAIPDPPAPLSPTWKADARDEWAGV